jgi:hypothetical protein
MKTNVTYIDAAKFETLIAASGLPMSGQKGFVKVSGPKGRVVYVASTKRVGRVDISGFEMEGAGYVTPHCGPFGNVKQQLDFSLGEDEILSNFAALLEHMKSLAPVEKAVRAPATPKADEPKGWSPKAERAKKIAAKAKKQDEASSAIEA